MESEEEYHKAWLHHVVTEVWEHEQQYRWLVFAYWGKIRFKPHWKRDQGRCRYCGDEGQSIDHVLPKSRGGERTMDNGVVACLICNGYKGDRTPEEAGMTMFPPGTFRSPEEAHAIRSAHVPVRPKRERKPSPLTQTLPLDSEKLAQAALDAQIRGVKQIHSKIKHSPLTQTIEFDQHGMPIGAHALDRLKRVRKKQKLSKEASQWNRSISNFGKA